MFFTSSVQRSVIASRYSDVAISNENRISYFDFIDKFLYLKHRFPHKVEMTRDLCINVLSLRGTPKQSKAIFWDIDKINNFKYD